MENEERQRLERKLKRAKRESGELQDLLSQSTNDGEKRALAAEIEDAQSKARRIKRKLK